MQISHAMLKGLVGQIFLNCGCHESEAVRVAHCLVESNLVGHDSHGVICVNVFSSCRSLAFIPGFSI